MDKFLKKIGNLQEIYRKINLLKMDELINEKKEKNYKSLIEEMRPIALSLKEEDGIDQFNFSSDEEFYISVKIFLNKTA